MVGCLKGYYLEDEVTFTRTDDDESSEMPNYQLNLATEKRSVVNAEYNGVKEFAEGIVDMVFILFRCSKCAKYMME